MLIIFTRTKVIFWLFVTRFSSDVLPLNLATGQNGCKLMRETVASNLIEHI